MALSELCDACAGCFRHLNRSAATSVMGYRAVSEVDEASDLIATHSPSQTADDLGFIDPRHMFVLNLGFGPFPILFGVMITLMTISTRGFVTILTGAVMPYGAACFLSDNHF